VIEPDAGTAQRRVAPHVARNTGPIIEVLRDVLPRAGLVLEVASGTGEHGLHFARAFPQLVFQPTDPDPLARASIKAWRSDGPANLLPPLRLDASETAWPVSVADALLCINMVHISPWAATLGLMRGAGRLLAPGAPLILYGPYRQRAVPTAPSNEGFDQSLKSRNPEWGLRYLEDVVVAAQEQRLALEGVVEMPANNLIILFRAASPA
jgi:SAM-dependent methyltransferase